MNNKTIILKVTYEELLDIKAALLEKAFKYRELKGNCTNDDQISHYEEIINKLELTLQTIRVCERYNKKIKN